MRFGKRYSHRALPVLLAALVVVVCLFPGGAGGETISLPSGPMATLFSPPDDRPPEADAALPVTLFLNSHETEMLSPGSVVRYRFRPGAADTYLFRSFPIAGQPIPAATARLIRLSDGEVLAAETREDCFRLSASLEAEVEYELEITAKSAGALATEVMLDARGRSFENPISLPGESVRYAKTIVRARDVHWFSFVAPVNGRYSIRTEKTGGVMLDTIGLLTDSSGRMLAQSDDILFPGDANFLIEQDLTAGQTYYVRISAFSNLTGAYRLVLTVPQENQPLPGEISLSHREITLDVDGEFTLSARALPEGSLSEIVYASSDSTVVSVEPDGTARALSAGEATVWAISYDGLREGCRVKVNPVRATGMTLMHRELSLYTDEQATLSPVFEPANASDRTVKYVSSDESVVTVSDYGVLTGVSEGWATVTAVSSDGGFADSAEIRVMGVRPAYRALVLGEITYADGARLGGANTVQGVYDMLVNQSIDGAAYLARLQLDSTLEEVTEGVRLAFEGAGEADVSLFYINCHGAYEDGSAFIRLHDETRITVDSLADMLDGIPGKVIVILDFCQSGAFIGAGEEFGAFSEQTENAFSGRTALTDGRYTVITSASADEDSYRRSFARGDNETSTAAIMARSLCEGAGWDIIYDRGVSLKADGNRDGKVTVQEIFEYSRRRVAHYLEDSNVSQTVHLFPEGDDTVLFGKAP